MLSERVKYSLTMLTASFPSLAESNLSSRASRALMISSLSGLSTLISSREIDEDIKKETIQKMSEKNQYVSKNRFDSVNQLGTIKNIFIEENLTEEGLKKRLNYEINAIKAESYKVIATVVGYTMDMNFAKVNYWENTGNIFWDFNRKVIVNSPDQGINNLSLIVGEMEMCYDSSRGAYTNLTLIQPLSYSTIELSALEENNHKKKEAQKRAESIKKNKLTSFLYGPYRVLVDWNENITDLILPVIKSYLTHANLHILSIFLFNSSLILSSLSSISNIKIPP